jgi:formamidopyrimidine-DNA glycosylase
LYADDVPELPEVETIAQGLNRRVANDAIESVWIGSRKQPLKSPAALLACTLEGKRIVRVHRAGKHIVFDLDQGRAPRQTRDRKSSRRGRPSRPRSPRQSSPPVQWIVHLGMTGRLMVSDAASALPKHTHLVAKLASGRELRFVDPRMFGKLSIHTGGFDPGGVEPLEASEEQFLALFKRRKTPIKSALLNQKLLRGVGNIYADESLFRAAIAPRRRAATLTRAELRRLRLSVREVLSEAIAAGGSSISDYVDADGEAGWFQLRHRVYGREGEPCLVCGAAIRRIVLAGRSSHYCSQCQK